MKLPCSIVSVFKAELSPNENELNSELALQSLKDLNVPAIVGKVGTGSREDRESVIILPESHSHMLSSLLKTYNQNTYLECSTDGICSVVTTEGVKTKLGKLIDERRALPGQYTLMVGLKTYSIEGLN